MSQTWFLSESQEMMIVVFETRHLNHIEVYTHAFFLNFIFLFLWFYGPGHKFWVTVQTNTVFQKEGLSDMLSG